MHDNLYPPTIQGAPPELTIPNRAYRRQVVIVLVSLIVFVAFYLSLVIGSGWAVVAALNAAANVPPPEYGSRSDGSANNYIALAVVAGVLFLFSACRLSVS